jgi:hypothetical protein
MNEVRFHPHDDKQAESPVFMFPCKDWFIVKSCKSDNIGRSLKGDSVLGVHSNVVLD